MSSGNQNPAGRMTSGNMDEENEVLADLPPAIRAFLNDRAPALYKPSQVTAYLRAQGEAATLARLRELAASDTKKTYGTNHPDAKDFP